jgi:hypothetical protein
MYLATLSETNVKSMQELVDWNIKHATEALPSGSFISPFTGHSVG